MPNKHSDWPTTPQAAPRWQPRITDNLHALISLRIASILLRSRSDFSGYTQMPIEPGQTLAIPALGFDDVQQHRATIARQCWLRRTWASSRMRYTHGVAIGRSAPDPCSGTSPRGQCLVDQDQYAGTRESSDSRPPVCVSRTVWRTSSGAYAFSTHRLMSGLPRLWEKEPSLSARPQYERCPAIRV